MGERSRNIDAALFDVEARCEQLNEVLRKFCISSHSCSRTAPEAEREVCNLLEFNADLTSSFNFVFGSNKMSLPIRMLKVLDVLDDLA